ncbi:ribonuclease H-like domain-containing protein [Tanacetum coccineum]
MKCLKWSELLFEEKWLQVRQRWFIPFREIKEILIQSGLKDKKGQEIEMDKGRLRKCKASLVGFLGETYHPLGLIDLWNQNEKSWSGSLHHSLYDQVPNRPGSRHNGNKQGNPVGVQTILSGKSFKEEMVLERERKARTTLLMALPEDNLAKFYKMTDAKEMREAIKSRFGGNDESKKMRKYILKQQFEGFSVSNSEGLHKDYDRFQSLLSQLEIHGTGVSTEDANHKFLRSLPSTWSQVPLIMRTKPGVDSLSFDDLNGLEMAGGHDFYKNEDVLQKDSYSEDEQENYALMAYSSSGSDTEMSARDKVRLGTSDIENSPVNDRYAEGMHAVPLPMTGIYIPFGPDKEIDDLQFTYGPKQSKPSEFDARSSDFNSCESNTSKETHESMPELVVNEPNVVSQPKVWSDAPIIKEYESDSDDDHVFVFTKELETPSFAFSNIVKHVKTPRQTVKEQNTCIKSPKPNKKDCSGFMSKKLGSGQRENRLVWNNVQRVNHQNQFIPKAVLTRTGKIQVNTTRTSGTNTVNTARHNFNSWAVPTNAVRKVNTVKPTVNNARPKTSFHKTLSPLRKPFNRTTTLRTKFSNKKVNTVEVNAVSAVEGKRETAIKPSAGIVDSGCSRYMTRNKAYLVEYQDFNGGSVAFGGSKGYITSKGKIKTRKKKKVLCTDTKCLVLSPEFKLPDENQVLLRIPRQNNMYSFNLKNIVPSRGLACLIAKATIDESNKWHRRLGHVNFKNLNKLVIGNLVRGLPSKIFQNDHTCVACQKGKQHKASCKAKSVSSISQPLQLLHMDLFGPTSVRSLNHKTYCFVITDDFSRCDNGTEFKNRDFIEFYGSKGIKREYRKGPNWLFDLDYLTDSINYQPARSENQANKHAGIKEANHSAGTQDNIDARYSKIEAESTKDYFILPIWFSYTSTVKSLEVKNKDEQPNKNTDEKPVDKEDQAFLDEIERLKR